MRKTAFIGHSWAHGEEMREKLYAAVENEIKNGCKYFTMGTRGNFDSEALWICRDLRKKYKDIKIEVVITSFSQIKPVIDHDEIFGDEKYVPYDDVETVMYEIEEVFYKRKITESNKQMIDTCDTLICYVEEDSHRASGARSAMKYAKKKGLRIVNLLNQ